MAPVWAGLQLRFGFKGHSMKDHTDVCVKGWFSLPFRFPCTFKPLSCRGPEAARVITLKFMMDPANLLQF